MVAQIHQHRMFILIYVNANGAAIPMIVIEKKIGNESVNILVLNHPIQAPITVRVNDVIPINGIIIVITALNQAIIMIRNHLIQVQIDMTGRNRNHDLTATLVHVHIPPVTLAMVGRILMTSNWIRNSTNA